MEEEGKYKEAIQEYLRAIKEDPEFGKAYSNLAVVYYNLGQEQKSREFYEMALAHMNRMTEQEKNSTRAKYYLISKNYKKAIDALSAFLKLSPNSIWARGNLAFAYYLARDLEQAVEEERQLLELAPKSIYGHYNMICYAIGVGDFELAEKEVKTLLNQKPEYEEVYVYLAMLKLIQGHVIQAIETYQKLKSLSSYGTSCATMGLADLAIYEGRLKDATQLLEKGIAEDFKNKLNDFAAEKLIMLSQIFLLQGKNALAIGAADRAAVASKKESVLFSSALIFLSAGQEEKAAAFTAKLAEKIYPEYQSYTKLLEGERKLLEGDIHSAIRLFQEAESLLDTWLSQYALGRAYLKAKAYTEAHEALELCLKRRGEATSVFFDDIPSCRYIPSVYYYLGRAQEGLKIPAASESYIKFLTLKEKADPGIAEVEDARERLAGLKD